MSNTAPHAMQSGANVGELGGEGVGGGRRVQNTPLPPKEKQFQKRNPAKLFF